MDLLTLLPLAFVMIAGPQIISAVFFATAESWGRLSAAYVLGAACSIALVIAAGYLLAGALGGGDGDGDTRLRGIDYAIVALLLYAMVHQFRARAESEPPRWMGRLQNATPAQAFGLGFMLLGFFPSDLVTSLSIGGHLGNDGDPPSYALPFLLLTLLFLASPALTVLALGRRGKSLLPRAREWMNSNSWIISELVLAFFIVIVLTG